MNAAPTGGTFLGARFVARLSAGEADFALLGMPLFVPHGDEPDSGAAGAAPDAVRSAADAM